MQVFQNFQLCLKAWNLPLAINILSDFPWNGRFILLFFRKTSAKYPTWNNCNLSVSFSSKIAIREKKRGLVHFVSPTITKVLSFESITGLQYSTEMLYAYFLFCYTEYLLKDKQNYFLPLIKYILSGTISLFESYAALRYVMTANTVWCCCANSKGTNNCIHC